MNKKLGILGEGKKKSSFYPVLPTTGLGQQPSYVGAKRNIIQLCDFKSGCSYASIPMPVGNVMKMGRILNLKSSGEACMAGLTNSEPESNHTG